MRFNMSSNVTRLFIFSTVLTILGINSSAIAADAQPNKLLAEQNARAEAIRLMGTATTRVATNQIVSDRQVIEIKLGGMTVVGNTAYGCGFVIETSYDGSILKVALKEKGPGWNNPQPIDRQNLQPGEILPQCDSSPVEQR